MVWHIVLLDSGSGRVIKSNWGTGTGTSSSKEKIKEPILKVCRIISKCLVKKTSKKANPRTGERWVIDNLNGELLLESPADFHILCSVSM